MSQPEMQANDALPDPAVGKRQRRAVDWLAAGVTALAMAAILGWLLYRERAALATISLTHALPSLAAGQLLMVGGLVINAVLWGRIMRRLGSQLPLLEHIHIYVSTHLARHLPGTLWYVVGRSAFYRMANEPARVVTIGSAIELLLSTMAAALVALVLGFSIATRVPSTTLPILALAIVLGALLLHPRSMGFVTRRLRLPPIPPIPKRVYAGWLAVDAFVWLLSGCIFWLIAHEISGIGVETILYAICAWSLMGALSIFVFFLPSNFGLTEVGLSLFLSALMPSSVAVVVAVLTRILLMLFTAIGCGLLVGLTTWRRRARRTAGSR